MKYSACLLATLLGCAFASRAQVDVEVTLDQEQFLSKEAVPVAVKIHNHSGQTLHFGTNSWLSFLVEAQSGQVVEKNGDPPTSQNFDVETSVVATQRVELSPFFNLSRAGHYKITATVKLDDWNMEINSAPVGFDVISGVKIWEETFGVPPASRDDHEAPEVRKYILQRAAYLKRLTLYFRLTDESESTIFKVMPLGQITSFTEPITRLDTNNCLHLLYAESARTYGYRVITPNGDLLTRQQFFYLNGPPSLKLEDNGGVFVAGAVRHPSDNDIPRDLRPTASVMMTNAPVATKP